MNPAIAREPWHDLMLSSLKQLADLELQRGAWIEHRGRCGDAVELICGLFDDTGLDDLLEQGEVFGVELDHHLRVMSELAGRINTERPPTELLSDPLWTTLAGLSASAVRALEDRMEPASP